VIAILRLVWAGVRRHRVQTVVVAVVVGMSTATVVLAAALLVQSNAPFDHLFSRQMGAHAMVTFDGARTDPTALRGTAQASGVTSAMGPFPLTTVDLTVPNGPHLPPMQVVGRPSPDGPLDRISLDVGRWPRTTGEIVISRDLAGRGKSPALGDTLVAGNGSGQRLTIVGVGLSVNKSADVWALPAELATLSGGKVANQQMLYRFRSAGSAAAVSAGVAAATAGLPRAAVLSSQSYLVLKRQADSSTAPIVPFLVAFAVLGLVMSVLIVVNVVGGAVLAGTRAIGVLKTLGLGPRGVVTVYVGQMLVPACVGTIVGAVGGSLLAVPVLQQTADVYDISTTMGVTAGILVASLVGVPALVGVAAALPALRAGRLRAAEAIAVGRAPRVGRGWWAHRLLSQTRMPRPLALGVGRLPTRPARTALTLVAIVLGVTTVSFALGLASSLRRVEQGFTRTNFVQVEAERGVMVSGCAEPSCVRGSRQLSDAAVTSLLQHTPGAAHVVAELHLDAAVPGLTGIVPVTAMRGDSAKLGYVVMAGRWFAGGGEAVAPTNFLHRTGKHVGDQVTILTGGRRMTVTITGEVFYPDEDQQLFTDAATVTAALPDAQPDRYEIALTPGADAAAYVNAVNRAAAAGGVWVRDRQDNGTAVTFAVLLGVVGTLTALLCTVAALGVFNTVVLNTRERVRDLGILKTLGMTPRQMVAMVVSGMAVLGVLAGVIGMPLGVWLHGRVLPVMAHAALTNLPTGFVDVYRWPALTLLACVGIAVAVLGALVPAGWAAKVRAATALRSE
jgi:putative ABC transport system permease protein